MLVIRLARFGKKKQAFFKLVVAEKARAVQKKFVKEIGYYNPHTDGGKGEFVFNKEDVVAYIKNGAQPSQTVARKLAAEGIKEAEKFIEKRATKPKKEEPKPEAPAEEAAPEENTDEAPASEEAPKEESAE